MKAGRSKSDHTNRILAALPATDYALLSPRMTATRLKAGAVLHEAGDEIANVYFPETGMISLLVVMAAGETVETATIGREGAVGATRELGSQRAFTRAVVQVTGRGWRVAAPHFHDAVGKSEALRNLILRHDALLLVQAQQTAACNALHSVEARLARWLLQTQDRTGENVVALTQEFLSQMLGVQRTTVTSVARTLQQAGTLRRFRGGFEILDRAALEDVACECHAVIRREIEREFRD
jgi:CRP-like cAMP-binding protein